MASIAGREIDEADLFKEAMRLVAGEVTKCLGRSIREYAELAVKKARGFGRLYSISPWTEFDFLVRVAVEKRHPGQLVWLLGLWPIQPEQDDTESNDGLDLSRFFVERLLGTASSGQTPSQRR